MGIQDTDSSGCASLYDSLRAPCRKSHNVAPLADGEDEPKRRVVGAGINQLT